jgi:glycosyltransferase involved in cell wall biosynthesis
LYIAGDGDERSRLEKKHIHNHDIKFFGFVSEEDKYRLLREASMLIVPSIREGWGQVVIQANMVGTPVIGYRVQGLRDAVLEGMTGMLVPKGDVQDLAEAIVYLFKNRNFLKKMSDEAIKYSRRFQWEESAKAMGDLLRTLR